MELENEGLTDTYVENGAHGEGLEAAPGLGWWSTASAVGSAHSRPSLKHTAHRPPQKSFLLPFPF